MNHEFKLLGTPGHLMQNDLHEINECSRANSLPINTIKCEFVHFGKNNTKVFYEIDRLNLPQLETFRDSGLLL